MPSRSEWAIAIADYFFTDGLDDIRVHLHVTNEEIESISSANDWNLDEPLKDLIEAVNSGNAIFSYYDLVDDSNSEFYNLPHGLADFALAMVCASENWNNQNAFNSSFERFFNTPDGEPPFNQDGIGGNLRSLLIKIESWSETNQNRGNFDAKMPLYFVGWSYIGLFYAQLAFEGGDRNIARSLIAEFVRLAINRGYELNELSGSPIFYKWIEHRKDKFQGRIRSWLGGRDRFKMMALHSFDAELERAIFRQTTTIIPNTSEIDSRPSLPIIQPEFEIIKQG